MMITDFATTYGLFLLKTLTVLIAILIIIAKLARVKSPDDDPDDITKKLKVRALHKRQDELTQLMQETVLDKSERKQYHKEKKQQQKKDRKQKKRQNRLFVVDFKGDMKCSQVEILRQQIDALLTIVTPHDEILVKLESGGGTVHGYGLGASQLARLRSHNLKLTVAVDKVAASGGYMMACVASQIIAAPFAIIGSIGVMTQYPNFHKLLKKANIDVMEITAGQYKNANTIIGENTAEKQQKVQEEVNIIHDLFKQFVSDYRPNVDLVQIATGEIWPANIAKHMKLVDNIMTSDEYILAHSKKHPVFLLSYKTKANMLSKFMPCSLQNMWQAIQQLICNRP